HRRSREQLTKDLASTDPTVVCAALYSAAQHEPDWRWSQDQSLERFSHPALSVQVAALQAIQEIVYFQKSIDGNKVLPELFKLLNDENLAPLVEEVISDIQNLFRDEDRIG